MTDRILRTFFSLRGAAALGGIGLFILALGCGESLESSITGTVTLDGKPLHIGTVTLYPVQSGPLAYGSIQSDGTYKIVTGGTKGLNSGEYKVGVLAIDTPVGTHQGKGPPPLGKILTPQRYRDPETSGLKITVTSGSNRYDIALHSSAQPAGE
ncbi:MAG: hypothetical protein JXB10_08030 [Pirellulales bacterium]|nr:hypothetical protein [Pirellulales bacterium]